MQAIPASQSTKPVIMVENTFAVSVAPFETPEPEPIGPWNKFVHSFGQSPSRRSASDDGYYNNKFTVNGATKGRSFNLQKANYKTAHTGLSRELKNRHLQMIAIGGSIGTWLDTRNRHRETFLPWIQEPVYSSVQA